MLHGVVELASEPIYAAKSRGFLIAESAEYVRTAVDLDEIETVLISSNRGSVSISLLSELAERGIALVVCGKNFMPIGMNVPVITHGDAAARLRAQVKCTLPRRKRIWQRIVQAKIVNQAIVLAARGSERGARKLSSIAAAVKSGDTTNREAYAAQVYWRVLLGDDFRRDRKAPGRNGQLNYGYSILRSSVARAIAGAGLSLSIGLHHADSHNSMCLVDDLMEPFRPIVDWRVVSLTTDELNPETKRALSTVLAEDLKGVRGITTLSTAIGEMAMSFVGCLLEATDAIQIAEWAPSKAEIGS